MREIVSSYLVSVLLDYPLEHYLLSSILTWFRLKCQFKVVKGKSYCIRDMFLRSKKYGSPMFHFHLMAFSKIR